MEVSVPVRIGLPALGNRVLPCVNAGPAFAWRIDCSVSVSAAGDTPELR